MSAPLPTHRRLLVIDDNRTIHQDFRKILCPSSPGSSPLDELEADIFGAATQAGSLPPPEFELDSAFQGEEGVRMVQAARQEGRPYAVAFVDIRMPPGIDGVETCSRIWKVDPDLQVVICSAYADYSWEDVMRRLGLSQRLIILRKPFDGIEVRQLAYALTEKWELLRRNQLRMEELARAVEERTRQLEAAHTRLAQVQRLEALGRLSAELAPEVNDPLRFILADLGYLRSALEGEPSRLSERELRELREVCGEPLQGAERLHRILRDMRLISRMDARPPGRVDVRGVLQQALLEARALLGPDVRLLQELQEVPGVCASEQGLLQVFLRLLANAAHALRGRGPEGWVRVVTHVEEGSVVVEVRDNGGGIAPQHLEHLFDPFFTPQPRERVMGLGLSICQGIISELGGELTVESVLGQGSTFRVRLPSASES